MDNVAISRPQIRLKHPVGFLLSFGALLLGGGGLAGHLLRMVWLYQWEGSIGMAVNTALALVLLSVAGLIFSLKREEDGEYEQR